MEKRAGCTHDDAAPLPAGAYAAPIGICRCCGFAFMYIGSGHMSMNKDGTTEGRSDSPDPTLCVPCGGRIRRVRYEHGTVIVEDPGSTVV